jgi:DNA-binding CsgD family transcriptional regulator
MLLPTVRQGSSYPAEKPGTEAGLYRGDLTCENDQGPLTVEVSNDNVDLTPLEKRVIALAAANYSPEESAKSIGISVPAIRQHLATIYEKLRVSDEFELILFAIHHQLIDS